MLKTNIGFVEFCNQALNGNTGYVYGTLGQVCTMDLLDQCAKRFPANNLAGGAMRTLGNKWIDHRVTDCIGLLKYYVMSDGYGQNPQYTSQYDQSANGAFNNAKEKGLISTLPEILGICLYMPGHFGVYIGGGWVIEARGTSYGVVKTKVTGRGWTHWFKSPWIAYGSKPDFQCDTTTDIALSLGQAYQIKVTCNSAPNVTIGTSKVATLLPRYRDGNDSYFYLVGIGKHGNAAGIYVNNIKQFVARIK